MIRRIILTFTENNKVMSNNEKVSLWKKNSFYYALLMIKMLLYIKIINLYIKIN